jgi:hypothetical protein
VFRAVAGAQQGAQGGDGDYCFFHAGLI